MYFWPLSSFDFALGNFIAWEGLRTLQVYVVQGVLMVVIFGGTIVLYRRTGRTFLELFSPRLDRLLTDFIVLPFTTRCSVCGARASYRLTPSQDPVSMLLMMGPLALLYEIGIMLARVIGRRRAAREAAREAEETAWD